MKVLFLKPPFFRLVGSHNNKVPVELSYWRSCVDTLGIETLLYNADYTAAARFWSWKTLFERTNLLKGAVDGHSDALLLEIVECVMSLKPTVVVISSDDVFIPTVCMDNAFVNARLSNFFRQAGVFTVGVGKFYSTDSQFTNSFDLILKGGPNWLGADAIRGKLLGTFDCGEWDTTIKPNITNVLPNSLGMDYSYVVSRRGCSYPCSFCYNTLVSPKFMERPVENTRDDILNRMTLTGRTKYYFTDQIFTINLPYLTRLHECFDSSDVRECQFTVEGRSELIAKKPEMIEVLKKLGVSVVKMGVENIGSEFNKNTKKSQSVDTIIKARELLKNANIHATAYLMIGGDTTLDEYRKTLDFCRWQDFDSYVVNVISYPMSELGTDNYKYDAHFSRHRLDQYQVPDSIVTEYLDLITSKRGNPNLDFFGLV